MQGVTDTNFIESGNVTNCDPHISALDGKRAHRSHGARALLSRKWRVERARLLKKAFERVDAARKAGIKISSSVKRESRRLQGRPYRSDRSRKFSMGVSAMRSLYFHWVKSGRNDTTLQLKYATARPGFQLTQMQIHAFRAIAARPDTLSIAAIARELFPESPVSKSRFYDVVPDGLVRRCRRIFRTRLEYRRAERAFARSLEQEKVGK